jgi:hypothetical protein
MDDILSSGNIFAIAALAAGALALLKKHWYRWAQVLFTVAMIMANAKVLRWAYTSDAGFKTRIVGGCIGVAAFTLMYVWTMYYVQQEIKEAASEIKALKPVFASLTDYERAVLRQVVLVGRSIGILDTATLNEIETKTGFVTRTWVGHYKLTRDLREPLRALLAKDDRSSLVSLARGVQLEINVKSEGRQPKQFRNNEVAGEEPRALEGFSVRLGQPIDGLSFEYMGHFEVVGHVPYVSEGEFLTGGDRYQLEGFAIRLIGANKDRYNVFYGAHAPKFGNYDECSNGKFCGSEGRSRSLDTMIVRVVPCSYSDVNARFNLVAAEETV